jgi:hypothetical protein
MTRRSSSFFALMVATTLLATATTGCLADGADFRKGANSLRATMLSNMHAPLAPDAPASIDAGPAMAVTMPDYHYPKAVNRPVVTQMSVQRVPASEKANMVVLPIPVHVR